MINQLTGGSGWYGKMRKVNVVNGYGKFTGPNTIEVDGEEGKTVVTFDNAIVAVGSRQSNCHSFRMKTHVFGIQPMRWN